MSTPMFVDPEISTQANEAQSPRVPVPFPEDPYEAIRQAYLVKTETSKLPHTVASPTLLLNSTPPTHYVEGLVDSDTSGARPTSPDFTAPLSLDHPLTHTTPTFVPFLRRTARMVVRVPPVMSPSLSVNIAEDEDEEVEESSDSDSKSEDAVDEGPTAEDEGPDAGVEGLTMGEEGPGMRVESLDLGGDEVVPKGQQWAVLVIETVSSGSVPDPKRPERVSALRQPTLTTWIDPEDDRVYIDVPTYPLPAPPIQTPPSLEWSSYLLLISPTSSIVPSPISSPMIPLTISSLVASPATTEAERFLTELGARVEMQGGLIHEHTVRLRELSPTLFERYDRDIWELFTRSGAVRQKPSKDKCGLGYTETIASSRNTKIKKLGDQHKKLSVEPACRCHSSTAPASSNEQHRLSDNSAEKKEDLETNVVKQNDSVLITKKSILGAPKGNVLFGSNTKSKIIGKGMISHNSLTINDVSHVENLSFNLLSIGKMAFTYGKWGNSQQDKPLSNPR
ncbi:hypothetical protein Tco_1285202 [Tanacetum coccineum]